MPPQRLSSRQRHGAVADPHTGRGGGTESHATWARCWGGGRAAIGRDGLAAGRLVLCDLEVGVADPAGEE